MKMTRQNPGTSSWQHRRLPSTSVAWKNKFFCPHFSASEGFVPPGAGESEKWGHKNWVWVAACRPHPARPRRNRPDIGGTTLRNRAPVERTNRRTFPESRPTIGMKRRRFWKGVQFFGHERVLAGIPNELGKSERQNKRCGAPTPSGRSPSPSSRRNSGRFLSRQSPRDGGRCFRSQRLARARGGSGPGGIATPRARPPAH
jgi:hypothetical protein